MGSLQQLLLVVALGLLGAFRGSDAAPLLPAMWTCAPGDHALDCCTLPDLMEYGQARPRVFKEWKDYLLENPLPKTLKVRRAAHLVADNTTYLEQLNRAYQAWRDLPVEDPRSHFQQSAFHCMYGSVYAVYQLGHLDLPYSVHVNWLNHPFHRWFTFFHERILGTLVGDDTLALPFWNWDNQTPMEPHLPNVLPEFYRNPEKYSALYDALRSPRFAPGKQPVMVDLIRNNVEYGSPIEDPDLLRAINNAEIHWELVENLTVSEVRAAWFGHPMRAGDHYNRDLHNTFELQSHIALHFWVGDENKEWADMGIGKYGVRDPIFFGHHANVDRLWNVWKTQPGRTNYDDPDWLDTEFFFYAETGDLVRVTIADCLDNEKLGYTYEEVDNPWLTFTREANPAAFASLEKIRAETDALSNAQLQMPGKDSALGFFM